MTHPWAFWRLSCGYTQQQIADELDVTRHMVIRLEQSLFERPPERIVEILSELYNKTPKALIQHYDIFVHDTRRMFGDKYQPFKDVFKENDYDYEPHPLAWYRQLQGLSRIGFCKGLCLHQDPIYDWEHNKQRGIPQQLVVACNEINWDYGPLENAVTTWRINGRADALNATH